MDTGTGIAIAGVWAMAAVAWHSKSVTGLGMWIALAVALAMTIYLRG